MEYCSLMSGSSGNCHYVSEKNTHILIDAGSNCKKVCGALMNGGLVAADSIDGICLTHAHADHVTAVGVLARRYKIPVYATMGTWLEMGPLVGEIPEYLKNIIDIGEEFSIGDLSLNTFPTSHDARESVGYVLWERGKEQRAKDTKRMAIVTDTGIVTNEVEESIYGMNLLVLEANHDLKMLREGPYPVYLKKRISGTLGHLSNEDAAKLSSRAVTEDTSYVLLAHLSQSNNTPELAKERVEEELKGKGVQVMVLKRFEPSPRIVI